MEVTKSHVRAHTPEQVAARGMEVTPLRVLLNPELTVEDYTTVQFPEGCASVRGITGLVDRYRSVSVSGQSRRAVPAEVQTAVTTAGTREKLRRRDGLGCDISWKRSLRGAG